MRLRVAPLLFIALPFVEIAAFILVGREIGVLATLGLTIATTVLGAVLLRAQGFGLLQRITAETKAGRVPGRELVHGVMILLAGMLLIMPGFVTDTLGLLLFIPSLRDIGWRLLRSRLTIVTAGVAGKRHHHADPRGRPADERVIDLEDDEFSRRPDPASPWHRDDDSQNPKPPNAA